MMVPGPVAQRWGRSLAGVVSFSLVGMRPLRAPNSWVPSSASPKLLSSPLGIAAGSVHGFD